MWYIFPTMENSFQYDGDALNKIETRIKEIGYLYSLLRSEVFFKNLEGLTKIVYGHMMENKTVRHIFNSEVDAWKFISCMWTFFLGSFMDPYILQFNLYHSVLQRYYQQINLNTNDIVIHSRRNKIKTEWPY